MKKYNKLEIIGITLLGLGILVFILDKVFTIEFLSTVFNYGRYLFIFGAVFWYLGYNQKKKALKENKDK